MPDGCASPRCADVADDLARRAARRWPSGSARATSRRRTSRKLAPPGAAERRAHARRHRRGARRAAAGERDRRRRIGHHRPRLRRIRPPARAPHDWLQHRRRLDRLRPAGGDRRGDRARRTARCVALEGDGSAMYTLQALWTMARENLDVTVLIFANRAYQILHGELASVGAGTPGRKANDMLSARPARSRLGVAGARAWRRGGASTTSMGWRTALRPRARDAGAVPDRSHAVGSSGPAPAAGSQPGWPSRAQEGPRPPASSHRIGQDSGCPPAGGKGGAAGRQAAGGDTQAGGYPLPSRAQDADSVESRHQRIARSISAAPLAPPICAAVGRQAAVQRRRTGRQRDRVQRDRPESRRCAARPAPGHCRRRRCRSRPWPLIATPSGPTSTSVPLFGGFCSDSTSRLSSKSYSVVVVVPAKLLV